jgi:transposase-like protein
MGMSSQNPTNGDLIASSIIQGTRAYSMYQTARGTSQFNVKTKSTLSNVNLQERANAIQNSQSSQIARNRSTTAVAEIKNSDGTSQIVVSSSRQRLTPAQRNTMQQGEVEIKGNGHAESTIVNHVETNGGIVSRIAASRPICESCQEVIGTTNALIESPTKPVKIPYKVE